MTPSLGELTTWLWNLILWPFRATKQHLQNIATVLRAATPEDFVPPWAWERFWNTYDWIAMQFPAAAGYKATPYEQMRGSIVLAVALVMISIGALTPFAAALIPPFLIGALRLHPVADRLWPLSNTRGEQPV